MDKSPDAFRTISEVAQDLALPQHVLRFWETRFAQIKPLKRGGGRRYYRPDDIELLRSIRHLLYADGYTIKGVQRLLREHGAKAVAAAAAGNAFEPPQDLQGTLNSMDFEGGPEDGPTIDDGLPRQAATADALPAAGLEALFGGSGEPTPPQSRERPSTGFDVAELRAVLAELAECQRLLTAARSL